MRASTTKSGAEEAMGKVGSHAVKDSAGDGTFGDGARDSTGGAWGDKHAALCRIQDTHNIPL